MTKTEAELVAIRKLLRLQVMLLSELCATGSSHAMRMATKADARADEINTWADAIK